MLRFSEIGEGGEFGEEFAIEIISHSILNKVWRFCEKGDNDRAINWNIRPGAKAYQLLDETKAMAMERKNYGQRVVFGLHVFQNSIARGLSNADVIELKDDLENFFITTMGGYHDFFWILVDRPPELKAEFGIIADINETLFASNKERGWKQCYPGMVCERMRKGRLLVQPWKWRENDPEYTGIRGPGYHPHDDVMPAYGRYLRNFVNSHVPY